MTTRQSILIGLAISLSLATGYIAGRIQERTDNGDHAGVFQKDTNGYPPTASTAGQQPKELRAQLNPRPTNAASDQRVRTQRQVPMESYASSKRAAPQVQTTSESNVEERHVGTYFDPDRAEEYVSAEERHIGTYLDPDEPWSFETSDAAVSIGNFIDPDH